MIFDDLPAPRTLALEQRGENAESEQHAAAAEVTNQVERRERRLALAADRSERARDRNVVDVVPRHLGHRAGLAPTRHAAVDDCGVSLETDVGSEAQPLGHTRSEALDQGVGLLDEFEQCAKTRLALQVECDRATPACQEGKLRDIQSRACGAIDADDFRTHVREHHGAEGARPDAADFDDAQSGERAGEFQ